MSSLASPRSIRIAVDIGGTFTDLVFLDEHTGRIGASKTPTTPDDPAAGLFRAIAEASQRHGFTLADVRLLVHGTTIATNAVLTRDFPRAALLGTAGFEDVLELARGARRDIYGLSPEPRLLLVPRRHRYGIAARMDATGRELSAVRHAQVEALGRELLAQDLTVVAVSLLHAHANPAHELQVREILLALDSRFVVSLSHEVSPEIREYERTVTTVLNALLVPVVGRYIRGLQAHGARQELAAPIYLVQSNGGAASLEQAARLPAKLLLSGPSGGVLATERIAAQLGLPDVVGVDMGGTSYDISVIRQGRHSQVPQGAIEGIPIRLPMVSLRTIGAGGGSIVWRSDAGRLGVGPQSAGAVPGPACYGKGGEKPTVTDANLILGRLDAQAFAGGTFTLDEAAARQAMAREIAEPSGLSTEAAAEGVIRIVTANLATAIRLDLFEKGLDPRDFALMSFGGAGGVHAVEVAQELGVQTVVFPTEASVFSALGILMSDIVHNEVQSCAAVLQSGDSAALAARLDLLARKGRDRLAADGIAPQRQALRHQLDLRYEGQGFDLTVDVLDPALPPEELSRLAAAFHALHRQQFSFDDPGARITVSGIRLAATGRLAEAPAFAAPAAVANAVPGTRRVYLDGAWQALAVYQRDGLAPSQPLPGPLLVDHAHTTLYLPAGWTLEASAAGHLIARQQKKEA